MNNKSENVILREKLLSMNSSEIRSEFFRPDEGIRIYHIGRESLMTLAKEADALYKVGKWCVIHKGRFEENLEKYKVGSEVHHD